MEALIKQQTEALSPETVEELVLDEWHGAELTVEHKGLLETFENLEFLSFRGCGLTSLANFPQNKSLFKLDLSSNQLANNLEPLSRIQGLMHISLESNLISSFDAVQSLTALPDLRILDLLGTPLAAQDNYRAEVFRRLPALRIVDGCNSQGSEVADILATLYQQDLPPESSAEEDDEEASGSDYSSEDEAAKRARGFDTSEAPDKKPRTSS